MANVDEYKLEIRRTFALVEPIATQAAAIFYPTLWEVNPTTKVLFKNTDMDKQGEKLMKTLGIAVASLNSMDKLVPILQLLGRKHVSYGVTAEMYPSVGEALLLTLEKGLGEECTPETKAAWTWVLGVISGVCIEAAKKVDPSYGETKVAEDPVVAAPVSTISNSEAEPVAEDNDGKKAAETPDPEVTNPSKPAFDTIELEAEAVVEKYGNDNGKVVETTPEETPKAAVEAEKEA